MYDKLFGSYLLNKGVLSAEALREILDEQQSIRVKIGVLAIRHGLMSGSQVEEVTQLQRTMDKRFGEIAVGKGYLTEEQVETLLAAQGGEVNLKVGQAAIDKGYLNYEQLDSELSLFEKESGLSQVQLLALRDGDPDRIVRELLDFSHLAAADLYYDYVSLFLRSAVRFLDRQPWLSLSLDDGMSAADLVTVTQRMQNGADLLTGFITDNDGLFSIAGAFAKMEMGGDRELAEASVGEFLNLHNGIFTVNMSDRGIKLDLQPPLVEAGLPYDGGDAVTVTVHLGDGQISLLLKPV